MPLEVKYGNEGYQSFVLAIFERYTGDHGFIVKTGGHMLRSGFSPSVVYPEDIARVDEILASGYCHQDLADRYYRLLGPWSSESSSRVVSKK